MNWAPTELHEFDTNDEILLFAQHLYGPERPFVTMWTVQVYRDVVARCARQVNPCLPRALTANIGHIRIGSIDRDVTFRPVEADGDALNAVYHDKYERSGDRIVCGVVGAESFSRAIRTTPIT